MTVWYEINQFYLFHGKAAIIGFYNSLKLAIDIQEDYEPELKLKKKRESMKFYSKIKLLQ